MPHPRRCSPTLLLALLLVSPSLAADLPVLRTVGLHLINPAAQAARWLGPGLHPGLTPDGSRAVVQAARGLATDPPLGTLYSVDLASRAAKAFTSTGLLGACRVSPSGRYIAALQADRGEASVVVLELAAGRAAGAPRRVGALTPRSSDAYAWAPSGDTLYCAVARAGADSAAGLWRLNAATGAAEPVASGAEADGVWPSPDGRFVAVRIGQRSVGVVDVKPEDGGAAIPMTTPWAGRPDVAVLGLGWAPDGSALWLHTAQGDAATAVKVDLQGGELARQALPGSVVSDIAWQPGRALYLRQDDDGARWVAVALDGGKAETLATVAAGVPLEPHAGWPVPAPAPLPDGRLLVALGRTDRWGVSERDKTETTDVIAGGRTARVVRRDRNVGPSGVVFRSPAMRFRGQARPQADSSVVADTRPGGMRWDRPSPPRWVMLHHTATRSDSGSLNALTTRGSYRVASLYEDITPEEWIRPEPGTKSVHYLVLRSGAVLQVVEERYLARHAGTGQWLNRGPVFDFNSETIGIEIVANGNDFTDGQVRNVGRLVADICRRQHIPLEHITGQAFTEGVIYHRDVAGGLRGKPDPAGWPWGTMMRHANAFLGQG